MPSHVLLAIGRSYETAATLGLRNAYTSAIIGL